MRELKFLNNDELTENIDQVLISNKKSEKSSSFTYLSTSISYAKEEKEEQGSEQLGNTLINQIF